MSNKFAIAFVFIPTGDTVFNQHVADKLYARIEEDFSDLGPTQNMYIGTCSMDLTIEHWDTKQAFVEPRTGKFYAFNDVTLAQRFKDTYGEHFTADTRPIDLEDHKV